jgi:signal recognition particle subunit SRP54
MFASTGELDEFELFHPDRMASRILDMGDILTLIEQAQKAFDEEQAARMAAKFAADEDLTLDDFLQQLAALKNMGSLKKMLGMLPGMGELREQLENFDEREMDRVEAIIKSMTPQERSQPRILNGSRRLRIARGSGTQVSEVNQLLERFGEAQKMMRQMRKGMGGMPGMPGMPGVGGGKKRRGKSAPPSRRGKAKSGNPAKRAQQEREAAQRAATARDGAATGASTPGGAFGLGGGNTGGAPGGPGTGDPSNLQLPPGFEKFLAADPARSPALVPAPSCWRGGTQWWTFWRGGTQWRSGLARRCLRDVVCWSWQGCIGPFLGTRFPLCRATLTICRTANR